MSNTDKKLGSFLIKLSEDHQLHKDFVADPKATMAKHQLSADEVHTVLSKNSKAMSAALVSVIKGQGKGAAAAGGGSTDNTVVVVVVVVAMPGELNR